MTFLAFTGLINALTSLILGLFGYLKKPNSSVSKAYLNVNLSITLYSIGYFLWQTTAGHTSKIFWFKVLVLGVILINAAFLHFVFAFTDRLVVKRNLLRVIYAVSFVFIYFNFSGIFYNGFILKYNLGLWPIPSLFFNIYLVFWFIQVLYGFIHFIRGLKTSSGFKHEQIKYCIVAAAFGFIGGASNWPMWYDIKFSPYLNILIAVYVIIVAYAIIRHKLLDIEVIVKKTLVFAGLFGFVFTIIIMAALLTQEFIAKYIPHSRYLALAISAVIIVLLQQPVYNFLISLTNKYLFQKKYDARTMLKDFSNKALTILNLDTLCNVTIEALVRHLCLSNCAILLLSKEEVGYQVYNAAGVDGKGVYFDSKSSLVQALKANYQPLLYQSRNKSTQASEPVKKDMEKIKSMACLPLVIHNEMVGILSLGAKKSDQPYDENDIDIITTLMKALSIAISNAKLFMQASQCEKLAAIGTLASAVNHEVCNPLNRISIQIQAYILNKKAKPFENRDLENQFKEVEKIMYDIMSEIQKVASITGKLSNFAKPKKIVDSKPINIKESVKDTLNILGHKLQSDRIHIEENIPLDLPDIIADKDQMQEIFFNLIKNAAEAIKEKGCILITAKEDNNKVKIEVTDSGCGIPEDKLDKIFEPFVTTKTDGSGYGLAVVREIILRNKGSITARNNAGGGSTFCLEFPKA
ncbi:MAG: ATP-binding protein [Candidatus Omnitrophica bacterium]|jgi:signal transduction histidine kinase|nr:ATP-binding protein [Candidatus Omnitrophota bacterium]